MRELEEELTKLKLYIDEALHPENDYLKQRQRELEAQVSTVVEVLQELVTAKTTLEDDRLNYVEVQVSKATLQQARETLQQTLKSCL